MSLTSHTTATLPPAASGLLVFTQAIEFPTSGAHDISNPVGVVIQ